MSTIKYPAGFLDTQAAQAACMLDQPKGIDCNNIYVESDEGYVSADNVYKTVNYWFDDKVGSKLSIFKKESPLGSLKLYNRLSPFIKFLEENIDNISYAKARNAIKDIIKFPINIEKQLGALAKIIHKQINTTYAEAGETNPTLILTNLSYNALKSNDPVTMSFVADLAKLELKTQGFSKLYSRFVNFEEDLYIGYSTIIQIPGKWSWTNGHGISQKRFDQMKKLAPLAREYNLLKSNSKTIDCPACDSNFSKYSFKESYDKYSSFNNLLKYWFDNYGTTKEPEVEVIKEAPVENTKPTTSKPKVAPKKPKTNKSGKRNCSRIEYMQMSPKDRAAQCK